LLRSSKVIIELDITECACHAPFESIELRHFDSIRYLDLQLAVEMSDTASSSSKKRTLTDAGLDESLDNEQQNHGKRVVIFEAFKLFDVQSAVDSCSYRHVEGLNWSSSSSPF
jgi:hypothetical protein